MNFNKTHTNKFFQVFQVLFCIIQMDLKILVKKVDLKFVF